MKKHGVGYSSGQYTAAQPDIDTPTSTVPTSSTVGSDESDEICEICGFSDESGLVGIGLGVPVEGDIDWVQCDLCDKWYHLLCLALSKDGIPTDSHWYCKGVRIFFFFLFLHSSLSCLFFISIDITLVHFNILAQCFI